MRIRDRLVPFLRRGKMARRKVVEIRCDRCDRVEHQQESEISSDEVPELELSVRGEKVTYQDLCRRCRSSVENYVNRLKMLYDRPDEDEGKKPTGTSN